MAGKAYGHYFQRVGGVMSDKKPKVIKAIYLPPRIPWLLGIVLWLLLDRLAPPGYVLGIVWTLYGVCVLACVFSMFHLEHGAPRDIEPR